MKIRVNEKQIEGNFPDVGWVRHRYKSDADIIIVNGFIVPPEYSLSDGDVVYLIKRGEKPDEKEMEFLLTARHTPGVHEKIKDSCIAVAGLGGLGSHAAVSLARMGVGRLILVDFDVIIPSNINRQEYFIDQIGMKKTVALAENLRRINPYTKIETQDIYVTENNAGEIFTGADCIIEAFDGAENKAMLINKCAASYPDALIVGASGVAGLDDISLLNTRKLGKNVLIVGDLRSEARPGCGLMATRVAAAANIQAQACINYLIDK